MKTTGYSGTPLTKKLGIKESFTLRIANPPDYYFDLLEDLPRNIDIRRERKTKKDFIHYFTTQAKELKKDLVSLIPNGMIWISWPKKSSGVITDVTEDVVRQLALANGLVDIKVCAVDKVWSGLKLVIPVKDRNIKS